MVELVTALEQAHRESPSWRLYGLCHQAATRIAELEAENERLRKERDGINKAAVELLREQSAEATERLAGARVKPLEWEKGVVDWARPLPGMKYVACSTTPSGSWAFWLEDAPETRAVFGSEAEAKAAAQDDYERRILSALAEPAGEAEPVACDHSVSRSEGETICVTCGSQITTPPDASAIRGALDIPECVLSLCVDKITLAFETSEDAGCAFDAIEAALAGAKP